MSMNQEIKAQWTAALRSGEYEQGTNRLATLRRGGKTPAFCCLGVLCDLAVKAGLELEVEDLPGSDGIDARRSYNRATFSLPHAVIKWAGLEDFTSPGSDEPVESNVWFKVPCHCPDGECGAGGEVDETLAGLNDGGSSFAEIADVIDQQL